MSLMMQRLLLVVLHQHPKQERSTQKEPIALSFTTPEPGCDCCLFLMCLLRRALTGGAGKKRSTLKTRSPLIIMVSLALRRHWLRPKAGKTPALTKHNEIRAYLM